MSNQEFEINQCQVVDDEIDLVQLFQILLKRKYLIFCFFVFCLFGGGVYAFLHKPTYEYSTNLQIGSTLVGNEASFKVVKIEPSAVATAKLENVFIPAAIQKLSIKSADRLYSASVKALKSGGLIQIISKGGSEDEQVYDKLHTLIITPLIANHHDLVDVTVKQYRLLVEKAKLDLNEMQNPSLLKLQEKELLREIEIAEMELSGVVDQRLQLLANKAGIEETKKIVEKQIKETQRNLVLSYEKRKAAVAEVDDATKAMSFLMLNSDIQQNETRLATLTERLLVGLQNGQQQIENKFSENKRAQQLQLTRVEEAKVELEQLWQQRLIQQERQINVITVAENKIDFFQDTKALSLAVRSARPVGTGKSLILALAGMLGLMGGVMLAFLAEFMTKVRQQQARSDKPKTV